MKHYILYICISTLLIQSYFACSKYYTVQSGNTCWQIAKRYNISLDTFYSLNPGINCYLLQIGQQVCVSGGSSGSTYSIQKGDTCWAIAKRYNISLDTFYSLNPGINCYLLQIGQRVNISRGSNYFDDSNNGNNDIQDSDEKDDYHDDSSSYLITYEQFKRAVTACGYDVPSKEKYIPFVSRAGKNGKISSKRELAMFLANILHESGGLRYKREIRCEGNGCPGDYRSDGDAPGVYYFGRGFIQLTWSYNYGPASKDIYGDDRLIRNPDLVSDSDDASWAVSFWFWKERVHSHVLGGQFGASIKYINGGYECNPCRGHCNTRISYYAKILPIFGVHESPNNSGC